jgi:hypothetical protein
VQQIIRARQIRALYQRELTSLNRDRNLDEAARKQRADSLWRQAAEQLERLRRTVEIDLDTLPAEQRGLFDPPKRPVYLEHDE